VEAVPPWIRDLQETVEQHDLLYRREAKRGRRPHSFAVRGQRFVAFLQQIVASAESAVDIAFRASMTAALTALLACP
jgi:hypothetical protein